MTVLENDCFAQAGELMRLGHALALLDAELRPVTATEQVPLAEALHRVLAENVVATLDVPPADNAAVDGYAVYFDDLKPDSETVLPIAGRIAAGHPLGRPTRRGDAYRIFTGAPIPADSSGSRPDTVAMQEDCVVDGGMVRIPAGVARGANARKRAEDIATGDTVLSRGRRLLAPDIGLAASLGRAVLTVFEPLRVAVFSTGDEIRDPGAALSEGAIYDSNRFGIVALLQGLACRVTDLGILPDDAAAITAALAKAAKDHHVLITSGGVSTGEEDHVRAAVESLGAIHFWRLAIKPGRPIALGRIADQGRECVFIGLPGNPVAVMVTFLRIARPAILRLSGADCPAPFVFKVAAGFALKKKRDRVEWIRARLISKGGALIAQKHEKDGSGILTSMAESDGLVELGEEVREVKNGDPVDFLPFSEVMS
jgi:molybdopterin molybdotransferase